MVVQVDVVIVGAGLSGLTAARELVSHGMEVAVLEASDRVGGRTCTATGPDFGWADLGASYVGSAQTHIMKLIKELGVETIQSLNDLDRVHYSKGRQFRYQSDWPSFSWTNPVATWEVREITHLMDKMCREIPVDCPWNAPKAKEWDEITVKEFILKNCWTEDAAEFLLSLCTSNNTADPHEMSLLFYLWYMRQGLGIECLWAIKEGAQESRLVGGTQQISIKMAQQLEGRIHLREPVVQLQYADGVRVHTVNGKIFKGQYAILAVPPPMQVKIHFDPPLPSLRNSLLQRMSMGLVMKCLVFYDQPFWIEKGYNGFVTCNDGIEIVSHVIEDLRPGAKLAAVICFVYSKQAVSMFTLNIEDRKRAVCLSLARFYKSEEALMPAYYVDKLWSQEQYIGGAYTCYYPPGVLSRYGPALRAPINQRVFLAGTETALEWTGYMSGAVESGQRAAKEVLQAAGKLNSAEKYLPPELVTPIASGSVAIQILGLARPVVQHFTTIVVTGIIIVFSFLLFQSELFA